MANEETYLGDGVYASHDGYQFWLRAGGGEPAGNDHLVALEPEVVGAFTQYVRDVYAKHGAAMPASFNITTKGTTP
jgi:hypothetical protein